MTDGGRRRFELQACLGRGAYGEVYRAQMHSPGGLTTAVAVKILREGIAPDSDAVQRLRDEGRVLARLDHPALLRVLDLILLEGRVALITEFVDGADLRDVWRGPAGIGLRALVQVVGEVASGLAAALDTPVDGQPMVLVHRDIKPTNLRLGRHGQPKLLDFGIARSDQLEREAKTGSDVVVGSLPYMAPERFTEKRALPASDVFGLGATFYEAVTGGRRFYGRALLRDVTALAIHADRYQAHLLGELEHLPSRAAPVRALLASMLAYDPAARPTAAEVADTCELLADELDGPSLRSWCRTRDWGEASHEAGELEGRTLTEGTLPGGPTPVPTSAGTPVVNYRPMPTIDPGAEPRLTPGSQVTPRATASDGAPIAAIRKPQRPARPTGSPRQPTSPTLEPPRTEEHGPTPIAEPAPTRSRAGLWLVLGGFGLTGLLGIGAVAVVLLVLIVALGAFFA